MFNFLGLILVEIFLDFSWHDFFNFFFGYFGGYDLSKDVGLIEHDIVEVGAIGKVHFSHFWMKIMLIDRFSVEHEIIIVLKEILFFHIANLLKLPFQLLLIANLLLHRSHN